MSTSQNKSLSRTDRFRAQASSGNLKKTLEAFKAAVMQVEGEARCTPDDKGKLVKEKADWCRRFGEAMDALEVAQAAAEALHLNTEIEEAVLGLMEEAEKTAKKWEERSNTSLAVVEEEPEQLEALLAAERRVKKKAVDVARVKKVVDEAKSRTEDGETVKPIGLKEWLSCDRGLTVPQRRLRDEDNDSEDEVDGNSNTATAKTVEGSSVTSREPCDSCKRARLTGECKESGGVACERCHRSKRRCSWAAGLRGRPRKRSKVEVVIPLIQDGKQGVRTQLAKASSGKRAVPMSLSSDQEDEDVASENDAPVKTTGMGKVVMETVTKMAANGNAATQKERVQLHRRLDGLQSRLLQTVAEMNDVRLELAALDEDK